MPGRRREEGLRWEAPKFLLTGVPRGLGPGRMVHTWVAASVSLGSGVCPGAQVSFLRGSGLGLKLECWSREVGVLEKLSFQRLGDGCTFWLPASHPLLVWCFPFWVQKGNEVWEILLYLRSRFCAGSALCEQGVRAALGSHS